jgi:diguanylate cyclase (GGDEF)-like protein
MRSYPQTVGALRRLTRCSGILALLPCVAAAAGLAIHHIAAGATLLLVQSFWAPAGVVLALIAWQIRDRIQLRRQLELQQAVQQHTKQLERGQAIEASRNRILEMLVSNEPLDSVLDAIAHVVRDQLPEAFCMVLVKRLQGSRQSNGFSVGAAPVLPPNWLAAFSQPGAIPFEVWRHKCEYAEPRSEPAWSILASEIEGTVPATIRSVPVGNSGGSLGALLLLYPESATGSPWERILSTSARLAQLAIEHRRFCDQLDYQAHHDSLTGLPNRAFLDERLQTAVMEARSRNHRLAFVYIDVDAFKQINDRFSHRTGDALLIEVGNRMSVAMRPDDTLARIGGDEFNVLLPDIDDPAAAMQVASRLLDLVRQPIPIHGHDLTVTLSIGVAIFPDDAQEPDDLRR